MKIKVIAIAMAILAFFLFVGSPFQQAANALVIVDDAFIGIIIAAFAAFGIVFTSTGGFDTIRDYVNNVLNDYAESNGMTVSQSLSGIQTGVNNLGQIIMNNRFVVFMQAIASFIRVQLALQNNQHLTLISSNSSIATYKLMDLPFTMQLNGSNIAMRFEIYTGDGVFALWEYSSGDNYRPWFISNYPEGKVKRISIGANGQVQQESILSVSSHKESGVIYYVDSGVGWSKTSFNSEGIYAYPSGSVLALAESNYAIVAGANYELFLDTGTIETPYESPEYNSGDGAILDVGAAWGMTYDQVTYRVIPGTYEDSEITYDSEQAVQEQVTDTPANDISQEPGDYTVTGLSSVFPFCIPFDIYSFFSCLAADPVAPSFEWRFYVPGICDETIVLDLSQFDTVAQIVRTMELLAFIVGLAFVTRDKMIKG